MYKRQAFFANPCFTQIHPTCIPVKGDYQSKLTLMSESLRNSGRIWVPKSRETAEKIRKKEIKPSDVPEEERDYYLERKYPSFGNLAPREDVYKRQGKYPTYARSIDVSRCCPSRIKLRFCSPTS